MVAQKSGSVINVASMLGHVGATPVKQAGYCASKGGVVNLTRELALQWARKGVRVNALCPGWFPSEITAGMESDEGSQRFITQNSPIPRMGFAHELDGALLLLAGPAGTFITGQSHHRRRRLDRPLSPGGRRSAQPGCRPAHGAADSSCPAMRRRTSSRP